MIEVKLSQGAKPGHGGMLPGPKVTQEVAEARGIEPWQDCNSPAAHSAFSTPTGSLEWLALLREQSGGKPVGFKLCVGLPHEIMALVKAMLDTGITPDFIVVDGAEGGTGAAPQELTDNVGMPMREGAILLRNALVGTNLRDRIKIRYCRQDPLGCGHGAGLCAQRRLVQRRAGLHVLAWLRAVDEMPHRRLSNRCRHAGSMASGRLSGR